jgi:hypothetical protein
LRAGASRRSLLLWLLGVWLPVGGLFATLMLTAHQGVTWHNALHGALRMMVVAALLSVAVQRLADRLPWPHPFRLRFAAAHLLAAVLFAVAWLLLNVVLASIFQRQLAVAVGPGVVPFLVVGIWLYVTVAGVSYATRASERAARAEAIAARSQLAALRAQLHPHFLFNALHTVVQLIPRDPRRAAQAAEQLAGLLRTSVEEDRDLVTFREERDFVERYLDIERIRFGDRLRVQVRVDEAAGEATLPAFALQTLVENAVRHGAAPRVEPTDVTVTAALEDGRLVVGVQDSGGGATAAQLAAGGTGLARLRERLEALYGRRSRLEVGNAPGGGFAALLVVPQDIGAGEAPEDEPR